MELKMNPSLRSRRPAAEARPPVPETDREQEYAPKTSAQVRQQAREDRVELSRQAVEFLQGRQEESQPGQDEVRLEEPMTPEEKRQQAQAEKWKAVRQMVSVMQQQSVQMKEQSEQQTKALKEAMDKMKRCTKIAANIGKGHKVPPQDEKYLLENDPKAYMMAMILRMMEEEKRKVKSELEDEENQQEGENGSAAPVEGLDASGGEASAPEASVEAAPVE